MKSSIPQITLLSSSVINREFLTGFDTSKIEPGNFAHLHLIFPCAAKANLNLYIEENLIAVKRDNSSNYIYSEIFVNELWSLFEKYEYLGISKNTFNFIGKKLILNYYPNDILRLRLTDSGEHKLLMNILK
ncbi:MAG: hypothetical protein IPH57_12740 [Saprospiraceae bacterium]|nr:hypothetical protein [Saprospiraceae bacterium]